MSDSFYLGIKVIFKRQNFLLEEIDLFCIGQFKFFIIDGNQSLRVKLILVN